MKKCLLLTVLLLVSLTCNADYNDGVEAYQQGDYQRALKQWKAVAEQKFTLNHDLDWKIGSTQGTTEAQYGLALLYWQGKGVIQNYHEAQKWLTLAADSGHSEAQLKLAYIHLLGLSGSKANIPEAIKWFEKSAKQGNADAQYNLGVLYKDGRAVKQDIPVAKKWLTLAAQQGDAGAKALLAEIGAVPVAEKSAVVAQQTPDKSSEPQLIVAPYPTDVSATQAVENKEVVASKPTQPVLSKATAPALLINSITQVTQAVAKPVEVLPAPPPVIGQPAPARDTAVNSNDEHYAVQLLSSPKQNDTLAFVEQWSTSLSPLVATDKLKKSERIFIVVYGHYSSASEAKQAIASLPDELKKNHPWVVKMRGNTFVP